ncbi:phosphoglycerate dehydrogenase [Sinorhizobium sp. NFACC03]|uniref:phosphoglycerate dehydrogenase n=1 Tax=Sinorhizobium sp. NFACC03 TaxID=1566295 RepID=UPI000887686A|nr:phosphoglycerate dehydrogenase [Sinorhizobium sp. NFACC03]SDA61789.1 D-3-phosphoglycerate dehydrogenase [Sinorhizobium sp. NFACC03]
MPGRIAITPRSLSGSGHPVLSRLMDEGFEIVFPAPGKTPSEEDLLRAIPGCVGWLAGVEPISVRVLDAAKDLRVISRNGTGVDNIDLREAEARGITVERAMGANARGVAELAVGLLLSSYRHIPWSHQHLSKGEWRRRIGQEVKGRTLSVIGCGAIGREVVSMALGLGMEVIGYDPFPNNSFAPSGFRFAELDEALVSADAVSFHCPPGEQAILDGAMLSRMKTGVIIVNTARAELIVDTAMLAALDSGQVSTLATDVFHSEPPESSSLLSHERVILTPHAGGFTEESVDRATSVAVDNLLKNLVRT